MTKRFSLIILVVIFMQGCNSDGKEDKRVAQVNNGDCAPELRTLYEKLESYFMLADYYEKANKLFYLKYEEKEAIRMLKEHPAKQLGYSTVDEYLEKLFGIIRNQHDDILEIHEYGARCGSNESELILKVETKPYNYEIYSRYVILFTKIENEWKLIHLALESSDMEKELDKDVEFMQWGKKFRPSVEKTNSLLFGTKGA